MHKRHQIQHLGNRHLFIEIGHLQFLPVADDLRHGACKGGMNDRSNQFTVGSAFGNFAAQFDNLSCRDRGLR